MQIFNGTSVNKVRNELRQTKSPKTINLSKYTGTFTILTSCSYARLCSSSCSKSFCLLCPGFGKFSSSSKSLYKDNIRFLLGFPAANADFEPLCIKFRNPLAVDDRDREGCKDVEIEGVISDTEEPLLPTMVLVEPLWVDVVSVAG